MALLVGGALLICALLFLGERGNQGEITTSQADSLIGGLFALAGAGLIIGVIIYALG